MKGLRTFTRSTRVERSLGEQAYTAYWKVMAPLALPWRRVSMQEKRAWQAAARATVRAISQTWEAHIVQASHREDGP